MLKATITIEAVNLHALKYLLERVTHDLDQGLTESNGAVSSDQGEYYYEVDGEEEEEEEEGETLPEVPAFGPASVVDAKEQDISTRS